jgi:hypothetical protein
MTRAATRSSGPIVLGGQLVAFPPGLRPRLDDAGACETVEIGRKCVVSDSEQVNAMIERFLAVSRSAAA